MIDHDEVLYSSLFSLLGTNLVLNLINYSLIFFLYNHLTLALSIQIQAAALSYFLTAWNLVRHLNYSYNVRYVIPIKALATFILLFYSNVLNGYVTILSYFLIELLNFEVLFYTSNFLIQILVTSSTLLLWLGRFIFALFSFNCRWFVFLPCEYAYSVSTFWVTACY